MTDPEGFHPPPDLSKMNIDMSRMHAMDHSIIACDGYGGRRRHAWLAWEFLFKPWLGNQTLCRVGRHQAVTSFRMEGTGPLTARRRCLRCGKTLGPAQPI